jgi:hypothetical protein
MVCKDFSSLALTTATEEAAAVERYMRTFDDALMASLQTHGTVCTQDKSQHQNFTPSPFAHDERSVGTRGFGSRLELCYAMGKY